jgi:hypothetical protein
MLDESWSMNSNKEYYIKGVNEFINTQRNINSNTLFTLFKFNTEISIHCIKQPISMVQPLTIYNYLPAGGTSLYDALDYGIKSHLDRDNVILFVLTDGYDIYKKIRELTYTRHWSCIYLASNQNAYTEGSNIGIITCIKYNETEGSIIKVMDSCNIVLAHMIKKWFGVDVPYIDKNIPTDVQELILDFDDFKI